MSATTFDMPKFLLGPQTQFKGSRAVRPVRPQRGGRMGSVVLPAARAEELRAAWAPSTASNCTEQTPPIRAWLCLRSAAPARFDAETKYPPQG